MTKHIAHPLKVSERASVRLAGQAIEGQPNKQLGRNAKLHPIQDRSGWLGELTMGFETMNARF
jgi:hypothetical protein